MSETKNYYSILGVLPAAEFIVIRAAYRALAQKYHPDKWEGNNTEAAARIREINEAYEVLSNEPKRTAYDSQRNQQNDDSFDFDDDTMRSAFGNADAAQDVDWAVAVEFYPNLAEIYLRLKRTSEKLAFAYRSTMLETKDFKRRNNIAQEMERQFLERHFGGSPKILEFARLLIQTGNKPAAKELNRIISVLGKGANADGVIQRVKEKFGLHPPSARDLARRVVATRNVEDAKRLIDKLGGRVREKSPGILVVILDQYLLLPTSFGSDYDLTQWVIKNVAPKYE